MKKSPRLKYLESQRKQYSKLSNLDWVDVRTRLKLIGEVEKLDKAILSYHYEKHNLANA